MDYTYYLNHLGLNLFNKFYKLCNLNKWSASYFEIALSCQIASEMCYVSIKTFENNYKRATWKYKITLIKVYSQEMLTTQYLSNHNIDIHW